MLIISTRKHDNYLFLVTLFNLKHTEHKELLFKLTVHVIIFFCDTVAVGQVCAPRETLLKLCLHHTLLKKAPNLATSCGPCRDKTACRSAGVRKHHSRCGEVRSGGGVSAPLTFG